MRNIDRQDHEKVSHTAVMCAKHLGEDSDVPYASRIWQELRNYDEKVVRDGTSSLIGLLSSVAMRLPGMSGTRAMLEGRYEAVNQVLEREGNPHVMELASGLSPRGLEFTRKDFERIYVETDLPELQKIKREIVERIKKEEGIETPNYHLTPLNVINGNDFERAIMPYAESARGRPLAMINAGLLPYLSPQEKELTRDNIVSTLREYSPDGMWITPDLSLNLKDIVRNPLLKIIMKMVENKTGRKFSSFDSRGEAEAFAREGGLDVEVVSSAGVVDRLSTVRNLGLSPKKVRAKSGSYDVYVMKLS